STLASKPSPVGAALLVEAAASELAAGSEAASLPEAAGAEPQAARLRVRAAASRLLMSFFFMTGSPLSIFFQNVSGAAGTAAVTFARRAGGIWGLFSYAFPPWAKKKRQSASGALPRTVCPLRYAANCRHRETCAGCRSQLHMHIIMPSRRS